MKARSLVVALAALLALPSLSPGKVSGQADCVTDVEPNDAPASAQLLIGAGCFEGTLPEGDQDLALWEVKSDDAATRWVVSLEGPRQSLTLLQVFPIASAPGVDPPVAEHLPILEAEVAPDGTGPVLSSPAFLPVGRYLIGITRGIPAGVVTSIDGSYRYEVRRDDLTGEAVEVEPNDRPDEAMDVEGAFAIVGDLEGSPDHFRWSVPAAESWNLELDVPVGTPAALELTAGDGSTMDITRGQGATHSYDLVLAPGKYGIKVSPQASALTPYLLRTRSGPLEGDAEPNDGPADAPEVTAGSPIWGRLAGPDDRDLYRLQLPPGPATLLDARLIWRSSAARTICLISEDDTELACRRGTGGATLTNLALDPGSHLFEVRGQDDAEDFYLLRLDTTTAAAADFEAEPNDDIASASVIDTALGMRGRGGDDDDFFQIHLEGEPQLWQIDVVGSEIVRTELVRASGRSLAQAHIAGDGSSASLSDLYLVPGDHWLRVSSTGLEYRITTTPLGPPHPDGEREPNDDAARAQSYGIGSRRVGRLPTASDHDLYRFTLAAPQHIRLAIAQPPDGAMALRLWSGEEQVAELQGLAAGEPTTYDLWLEAGDHLVELYPEQVVEGTYELTSERLDPFSLRVDREPNDAPAWASSVPATLSWSGDAADSDDRDWFVLPPAAAAEPLRISLEGSEADVRLATASGGLERGQPIGLMRDEDGTFVSIEAPPPSVPLLLEIAPEGKYQVAIDGAGLSPEDEPDDLALDVRWDLATDTVAAYWPEEQHIESSLELTNTGPDALELTLDTTTSHHQWLAIPEPETVSLPAGGSISVPTLIVVGADAWGTEPVLISARAATAGGGQVSSSTEVRSSGEQAPSEPRTGWSLPAELLGGLNAASVALGAVPGGTLDPNPERRLFDGVTPEGSRAVASPLYGNGFRVFINDHVEQLPIEVEVDLAGDAPVSVVGTIINPQASEGSLRESPRDFELLLSEDGQSWESVLRERLSPLRIDQTFALPDPVSATHAKLRIWSKHVEQGNYLAIGEWKVVVSPGTAIGGEAFNIAEPTMGGHVVALQPFVDDDLLGARILDAQLLRESLDLSEGRAFEAIIGFGDGRAAQVTALEWLDPDGSNPLERLERVDVAASTHGPTGPWSFLGTWELARAADGSLEEFDPGGPTWIRYLRLSGRANLEAQALELPGALRVIERATDESYRSILGEWGYRSPAGPYEWLHPVDPIAPDVTDDAADSQADPTELGEGTPRIDRVEIDVDEDWYWVDVPAERNTLAIVVDGTPTVGVALTLFDDNGSEQPMGFTTTPDGRVRHQAEVEPERRYALKVEQPPFSAVFAFDTSPSMDPFLDMVTQGMRSYLADVRPGREAVTVVPFEEAPLVQGWQDDPYLLQDAFENHVAEEPGSSGAEAGLIDASARLAEREGARAILLVTDAETTTFEHTPRLWHDLGTTRPIIFAVHIGALTEPVGSRQRMQDWAAAGGGHYSYPTTHGEMDRAFERMATWLRRPAAYSLTYTTLDVRPARLAIVPSSQPDAAGSTTALAPGVGVEIILDTSGSMRKRLGGERRIDVAKASMRRLVKEILAEDVPVAIRTFGGPGPRKQARCATSLALPLGPLDRAAALRTVKGISADKTTSTPIAAALAAVPQDLAAVDGLKSVVLITDGAAKCGGDVLESIAALGEAGVEVKLDVVGFALEADALKTEMAGWAAAGGGAYYDATDAAKLAASVAVAVSAPFRVYGSDTEPVAAGSVGGEAVELDPGTYRVEVLTEPPVLFDGVELGSGASVRLELGATDE